MRSANADDAPSLIFPITVATNFKDVLKGKTPMGHCTAFRVTGAGNVTVRCKRARADHETEVLPCLEGETVYGKITEIVAADAGCFPIVVSA